MSSPKKRRRCSSAWRQGAQLTSPSPRPTPLMIKRTQGVPPRPPAHLLHRHAFSSQVPNRGWSDALIYADTGGLYALASRIKILDLTLARYQSRLFAVPTVIGEVRRRAT